MDLERQDRVVLSNPSRALYRAGVGAAKLVYNTAKHPLAVPVWSRLANKRLKRTEAVMPRRFTRRGSRRPRRRGARRSAFRSSGMTTNQRDVSNQYSRGRSRGSGRGARRFRYRVMQTVNANQPLSVFAYSKSFNLSSAVNLKGIYGVGLYTTQMTDQTDLKDLLLDAGIDIAAASPNPQLSSRVVVKSCCLDVQLRNRGTTDVLVDVYECINVRDPGNTSTIAANFTDMFNQMTTIGAKDWQNPAVSLFENPVFCRHYKVISKKETQIPPGDLISMQMRNGKDKSISPNSVISYPNSIPKISRFYIFVFQGIPEDSAGTARIAASTLTISYQKAYKYSIMSGRTTAQIRTG